MRIRRATEEDLDAMRVVMARAYDVDEVRLGYSPPPADDDPGNWVKRGNAWVGEHASRVMAVLLAEARDGRFVVWSLVVDPDWQREGNGRALMEHAEALARDAGLPEVQLSANVLLAETISHYERCGYEVRGRRQHPLQGQHQLADMAKRL